MTPRGTSEATSARYDLAREKARALLTLRGYRFPVDVRAIAQALEIPIAERLLAENTRGTIGDIGGAELLMPLARLREWWLAETSLPAYSRDSGERNDLRIQKLAREFGVTKSAMRVRLEQLRLL